MGSRLIVGSIVLMALVLTALHSGLAQVTATYSKNAMCIACHKATAKDMIERYQATKHGQVKLVEGMSPVDVYRRSVNFKAADCTYSEAGVGCQACHGPGSAHLKGKTDAEKQAAIVRPQLLKTPQQKLSLCGRCHGDYTVGGQPFSESFKAGDDLFALEGFKLNEVTTPGTFTVLNDFMTSKHAAADTTCITCHTSHQTTEGEHQLRKKLPDLCLDCHATAHQCTVAADQIPAGANCATCHMPGGRHLFKVTK
jgi:predicted CXXCH cytochrome family protein